MGKEVFSKKTQTHNILPYLLVHGTYRKATVSRVLQYLSDYTHISWRVLPPNYGLWPAHSKVVMINVASLPGNVFILILASFQAAVCYSS